MNDFYYRDDEYENIAIRAMREYPAYDLGCYFPRYRNRSSLTKGNWNYPESSQNRESNSCPTAKERPCEYEYEDVFVYALRTKGDFVYIGQSRWISNRMDAHATGELGSIFTKCFPPKEAVAVWSIDAVDRFNEEHQSEGGLQVEKFLHTMDYEQRLLVLSKPELLNGVFLDSTNQGSVFSIHYEPRVTRDMNSKLRTREPDSLGAHDLSRKTKITQLGNYNKDEAEGDIVLHIVSGRKGVKNPSADAVGRYAGRSSLLHSADQLMNDGRAQEYFDPGRMDELITAAWAYMKCGDITGANHILDREIDFEKLAQDRDRRHAGHEPAKA